MDHFGQDAAAQAERVAHVAGAQFFQGVEGPAQAVGSAHLRHDVAADSFTVGRARVCASLQGVGQGLAGIEARE